MVQFYAEGLGIGWEWQSIDSGTRPAPLGGTQTGKNSTDRGKIHILVDENGAPLALFITGANEHDKWSADDLLDGIVVERPDPEAARHPARRWVVERTIGWLGKRRSIRTRWCKNEEHWMALIKFAWAHILFVMAFYG